MKRSSMLMSGIALVAAGSMAAAWVSQHFFAMQPCPWCVLQRAIFGALALLAVPGLLLRKQRSVVAFISLMGIALALAGVKAAHWQHFVAVQQSCALTLADKIVSAFYLDSLWPGMFSATASCADAAIDLLGLPYEFWSLGLFLVLAIAWALVVWLRWREHAR